MSLLTILAEINCLAREKSSQVIELVSHDLANATLACDELKHFYTQFFMFVFCTFLIIFFLLLLLMLS